MTSNAAIDWQEANQRALMTALGGVRHALERHVAAPADTGGKKKQKSGPQQGTPAGKKRRDNSQRVLRRAAAELTAPSALDTLCTAFGLSEFERDLLLLCAGMELDGTFGNICSAAHGDPKRTAPTFGLAVAALPDAHWNALTPAAPLRRWRLIEVGNGDSLTTSPLRIDERVLHYLTGVPCPDPRLQGFVLPVSASGELPPSHKALAERIAKVCTREGADAAWPVILLCGDATTDKPAIAAAACAELGLGLQVIRAVDIPPAVAEREALARLWEREAVLTGSALLLDGEDEGDVGNVRAVSAFMENLTGLLLVTCREAPRQLKRPALRLDVKSPSPAEQGALWREALGARADNLNGHIEGLVAQFTLGAQGIRTASSAAQEDQPGGENGELSTRLWETCRAQARPRLDDLAQRIEPAAGWDDLILPEQQRRTLQEVAAHVRRRAKVYESWGFAGKGPRGLGISALFAGASGTGKTMAAEVLAAALNLDLYRIDLSSVVSKYIGETEKNLRRVFDAAEAGGAILLFDEADALFGKRGEVKDSHDRYANIEVSYLLQRMEAYRGLAILTTNMKSALDTAFLRRIRFVVEFPFPNARERAEIWGRIFPEATPLKSLDVEKLATLNVAGGNIRNIALHAAFLAADADEAVTMKHLAQAARGEYAKLEKPLTEAEIRGWQ